MRVRVGGSLKRQIGRRHGTGFFATESSGFMSRNFPPEAARHFTMRQWLDTFYTPKNDASENRGNAVRTATDSHASTNLDAKLVNLAMHTLCKRMLTKHRQSLLTFRER